MLINLLIQHVSHIIYIIYICTCFIPTYIHRFAFGHFKNYNNMHDGQMLNPSTDSRASPFIEGLKLWSLLIFDTVTVNVCFSRWWYVFVQSYSSVTNFQTRQCKCAMYVFIHVYIHGTLWWHLFWLEFRPSFQGLFRLKNRGETGPFMAPSCIG